MMVHDRENEIAELIRNARKAKGLSQPQLAARVKTSQQTIEKIENGRVRHSSFLPAIAFELGIPVERVVRSATVRTNGLPLAAVIPGHTLTTGERDLPVYTSSARFDGVGGMTLIAEPVEHVARPEPLTRVRDSYGIIVTDDKMAPELRPRDIALINPHLPPLVGDTCVFHARGQDGEERIYIASVKRITERDWIVTEWNGSDEGARDYHLKKAEWQRAHVVVGSYKRR